MKRKASEGRSKAGGIDQRGAERGHVQVQHWSLIGESVELSAKVQHEQFFTVRPVVEFGNPRPERGFGGGRYFGDLSESHDQVGHRNLFRYRVCERIRMRRTRGRGPFIARV